jgi:membrane protein
MVGRHALALLRETYKAWKADNVPFLAAGLSYFTVFSLAPVLIIGIAITGAVFGQKAAEGEIVRQISGFVGEPTAKAVQTLVHNARKSGAGKATAFSLIMLFLGSSGVFASLQTALNMIWDVGPAPGGFGKFIKNRLILFAMVIVVGVLMLLFFAMNVVIGALQNFFGGAFAIFQWAPLWKLANGLVQFGVVSVLSAAIFKFLPHTSIAWRDVWVGSAFTSLLLALGAYAIGLYFRFSNFGSVYGVAASVIVIFIWVYFSAQIFFFGAEFTWVYAKRLGSKSGRRFMSPRRPAAGPRG